MLNDNGNHLNDDIIEIDDSDLIPVTDLVMMDPCALAEYDRSDARFMNRQAGKIGWALLWLLGIPLPVLLVIYLIRGH
ncbi:MAG: hypothetical protein ABI321_21910 [Polyangia bacterium]